MLNKYDSTSQRAYEVNTLRNQSDKLADCQARCDDERQAQRRRRCRSPRYPTTSCLGVSTPPASSRSPGNRRCSNAGTPCHRPPAQHKNQKTLGRLATTPRDASSHGRRRPEQPTRYARTRRPNPPDRPDVPPPVATRLAARPSNPLSRRRPDPLANPFGRPNIPHPDSIPPPPSFEFHI